METSYCVGDWSAGTARKPWKNGELSGAQQGEVEHKSIRAARLVLDILSWMSWYVSVTGNKWGKIGEALVTTEVNIKPN